MTRLNLLLLVVLVASSVYLVRVSYDSRRLFAQLDRAQGEARQLARYPHPEHGENGIDQYPPSAYVAVERRGNECGREAFGAQVRVRDVHDPSRSGRWSGGRAQSWGARAAALLRKSRATGRKRREDHANRG